MTTIIIYDIVIKNDNRLQKRNDIQVTNKQFESITHPIRIRLISFLTQKGTATTQELAKACPEVPPATLYRHIARLKQDQIFEVARENKVNGISERVYQLKDNILDNAEATRKPDELMALFYQFIMMMLNDMHNYTSKDQMNPKMDGVGFRSNFLRLTDEEFLEFAKDLHQCIAKWSDRPPQPDQKLRRFSTILTPIDDD